MQIHGRAKLGPAGRLALCEAIERGMSLRAAAAVMSVSPATAHRWWHRYRAASLAERQSLVWALDRSSRPHRCPRLLAGAAQERICETRLHTGWGPRLVAGVVGHPHSTVWKVLHRRGLSRKPRRVREAVQRYEWPCPGDLLHMDIARYARFQSPGHRITRDRSTTSARKAEHVGYEFAHAIVDDNTRLAYVELHSDERAATVTAFVERALAWFQSNGVHAKRLMTDNAFTYVHNRSLRELLAAQGIKHLRTQPYRPQTNGKVERFHQTMAREWGYGLSYRSSNHRQRALPHWLAYYNQRRPHSGIGNQPPISRVHNLRRQNS
jgi:transposase InsO family protein